MKIILSTFETGASGAGQVWQVFDRGAPVCKELYDESEAWRLIHRMAFLYPHATFIRWDGYTNTQSPEFPINEAIALEAS